MVDDEEESLRPVNEPLDAWNAIYANFMSLVGTTAGQYSDILRRNATYLSQTGTYTEDPATLLHDELNVAGDFGEITRRYSQSAYGRGQSDPFGLVANTDAKTGNVSVIVGGRQRLFFKQANGSYTGEAGETATLTRDGSGAYTIRESDGDATFFGADGKVTRFQASNGTGYTANYTAGHLSTMVTNYGDTIAFSYNPQGLVSQVVDPVNRTTSYTYNGSGDLPDHHHRAEHNHLHLRQRRGLR